MAVFDVPPHSSEQRACFVAKSLTTHNSISTTLAFKGFGSIRKWSCKSIFWRKLMIWLIEGYKTNGVSRRRIWSVETYATQHKVARLSDTQRWPLSGVITVFESFVYFEGVSGSVSESLHRRPRSSLPPTANGRRKLAVCVLLTDRKWAPRWHKTLAQKDRARSQTRPCQKRPPAEEFQFHIFNYPCQTGRPTKAPFCTATLSPASLD